MVATRRAVISTVAMILACCGVGGNYVAREPSTTSPTASVILAVYEYAALAWPALFALAAVALTVSLATRRLVVIAHACTAGLWLALAVALWLGVFSAWPPGSWLSATMASALAVHCFLLTRVYAREIAWTQR